MGDAINLASRMEQNAEPGTILIAENTARLVRHAIALESLGALTVKGKAEPVNAYRVMGVKAERESTRGIVGLTSPLVGRANELSILQGRMDEVLDGRGQIVAVIGEAGLGKSRLIAELLTGRAGSARRQNECDSRNRPRAVLSARQRRCLGARFRLAPVRVGL
jgi:hypothetical protein